MKHLKNNKRGSSIVLLAMVFVTMMICITAAITIARALVVKSECESFGHVWTKAILSEYDRHLLDEYNIMAYWGNDAAVKNKIDTFLKYSASGKLDAGIRGSSSELVGHELGNLDNFETALQHSFTQEVVEKIMNNTGRSKRTEENDSDYGLRVIKNPVVLNTLPSEGIANSSVLNAAVDSVQNGKKLEQLMTSAKALGGEMALIYYKMGNNVSSCSDKKGFMKNEWEYIIHGNFSDEENFKYCKRQIFVIRNAANLAYILSDPKKRKVISAIAECATPGLAGLLTATIVAETWALAETEYDISELLDYGRVPFVKTAESWKTDIGMIIDSDDIKDKLDDDGKKVLKEKEDTIIKMDGAGGIVGEIKDGQTYDDYLLVMMAMMNRNIRLLRVMDIIQINMKYWHYRDFNMMEYYTGVRFTINANGKSYEFEDSY